LNHSILTDDTTPLTNDITPLIINTAIKAKSALYVVNLDVGLRIIQRIKGTERYVNIYLILRAATAILRIMIVKKVRELLTFILI
jgi:hypothetical protein